MEETFLFLVLRREGEGSYGMGASCIGTVDRSLSLGSLFC
jgi:hypothetical protein